MSESGESEDIEPYCIRPPPLISQGLIGTSLQQQQTSIRNCLQNPLPAPMSASSLQPGQGERVPTYVMLPSQSKPLQVVQGLDGVMYVLAPPVNNVTDNHIGSVMSKSSGITQLSPGTAPVMPQGISFSSPSALAAAAAAAQVNAGTLAAAALQGQKPASFPFIPVYTPLSVSSPPLPHSALTLQTVPLAGRQVASSAPAGTFLFPTQTQHAESSSNKRSVTSPTIHTLLAPNEVLSSAHLDRRTDHSLSTSSNCKCSSSPTNEPLVVPGAKSPLSSSTLPFNMQLCSPMQAANRYSSLDLAQRAVIMQDQIRSAHEGTAMQNSLLSPTQDRSSEETGTDGNPSGFQNVRSMSSLSRYVNQPADQNHWGTSTAPGTSKLERLLQTKPESEESRRTSPTIVPADQAVLALLHDEPHLIQFYDFFHKSELSRHLRIRVLTTEGGANILKWIEVTRQASHIEPNFGPIDAARILISSNGLCKLQLLFPYSKTLSTCFVPMTLAQANELFSELSPKHVICPGLPDCESKLSTLGYQPTNVRIVETPSMKRYDHDKCPIWHIPLPCNLYSESGQILHHMCKQCKNLLTTLNKTITKIAGLNAASTPSKYHELPLNLTAMASSSSSSPVHRPPSNRTEHRGASKAGQGRRRKRKAHPKDDETSGKN